MALGTAEIARGVVGLYAGVFPVAIPHPNQREVIMIEPIEILHLVFRFQVDKETWCVESLWRFPSTPGYVGMFITEITRQFVKEAKDMVVLQGMVKFKAKGQRIMAKGPEAEKVRQHLEDCEAGRKPCFVFNPLVVQRYYPSGGN